jgi:glycerol-3-phosphate dehydrogenase
LHADILSTYAGVRPVVHTGKADPSKESREFVLWTESGLLTITGGKLTTFRLMAHQALSRACRMQAGLQRRVRDCSGQAKIHERTLKEPPGIQELPESLTPSARLRLAGRYGQQATALTALAQAGELQPIGDTPTLWAELRWACRVGGVLHLDDLLLRRVRVGLLLPSGGQEYFARLRAIVQEVLHWEDDLWDTELNRYQQIWKRCYDIPR